MLRDTDIRVIESLVKVKPGASLTNLVELTGLNKPTVSRVLKRLRKRYSVRLPISFPYSRLGLNLVLSLVCINPRKYPSVKAYLGRLGLVQSYRLFGGEQIWRLSLHMMDRQQRQKLIKRLNQFKSWNWIRSSLVRTVEFVRSGLNMRLFDREDQKWRLPVFSRDEDGAARPLVEERRVAELTTSDLAMLRYFLPDGMRPVAPLAKSLGKKMLDIRERLETLSGVYDMHLLIDYAQIGLDQHILSWSVDLSRQELESLRRFLTLFPGYEMAICDVSMGVASLFGILRFPGLQSDSYFRVLRGTVRRTMSHLFFEDASLATFVPQRLFPEWSCLFRGPDVST
ncbi:MAG: helix-turn-helix transcriptional regulator [Candidatus Ranarchaeia archaeon]